MDGLYNRKSQTKMDDLGVPLFQETSIWDSHIHELGVPRFGTFFVVFHILGMSSSQLLLSQSFFRGVAQPKKQDTLWETYKKLWNITIFDGKTQNFYANS